MEYLIGMLNISILVPQLTRWLVRLSKMDLLEPEKFSVALDDVLVIPLNQYGFVEPDCELRRVDFCGVGVPCLRGFVLADGG